MERWIEDAGFVMEAGVERRPYVPYEVDTRRAYLWAWKLPRGHGAGQE